MSATFDADEVTIIHPKDTRDFRLYRWERNRNELMRSKIDRDPHVQEKVLDWLDNRLVDNSVSPDGREAYMPIAKGAIGLALIAIRKVNSPFDPERLKFIDPVKNHMAMAFENGSSSPPRTTLEARLRSSSNSAPRGIGGHSHVPTPSKRRSGISG